MKERSELVVNVPETNELARPLDMKGIPASTVYKMDTGGEESAHLLDYWRSIRKRLWLVLGIAVLITSLTAIYMSRKPDVYEAKAQVQVDLERVNPALGMKDSQIIVSNSGSDPAYFNTQLQILTGPGLLRRVAKTLDLENNKEFLKLPPGGQSRSTFQRFLSVIGLGEKEKPKASQEEIPLASSNEPNSQQEDMAEVKRLAPFVEALQKGLSVEPVRESRLTVKDTRLINLTFRHNNPDIAANVVNSIANTFATSNRERKTETNQTTGDYLKKRIAELQSDIRKGEEKLADYAKANDIVAIDKDQNTVLERLAGLSRDLLKAEGVRKEAESNYRAALVPGAAPALAADSNAKRVVDEATIKLVELRQKREELLVENTEEWPEVKQVNKQIEQLEKAIEDARTNSGDVVVTNLGTKYRQAVATEDAFRKAFNQQRSAALNLNEATINFKIIQQEIDTKKELLNGLLQNERVNDVGAAGTPNNIFVVENSIPPDEPVGPRRLMSVIAALVLSLAFGAGLALFLEYLDDTVRSADDIENLLRLPALAVIPSIEGSKGRRLLATGSGAMSQNGNGNGDNGDGRSELLIKADSRSSLAEAYRQLRTSVLLSTAGHAPKTLLVTSSVPSEGKTTTAVNTAISLSQTGAKVLVVDADMRRPRLHNIFQIENRHGLSSILSAEMTEAEVLTMVTPYEDSNLHLLTSGPVPPNPAELIGSEQMRRLIRVLENNYTHIVIDSPPIASFTDGVLISSMVDGVLLVVHANKSSRGIVRRSKQLLQEVGAKIFGVVLNNANLRSQDGYYYYQSYYHQSYYKGGESDSGDHIATGA
ncbi:MAG: polysaccharide biosynthesis tyrosine autokinase [Pyrinomonadaceae bacterium]|nr:polysaccharide biosynthesis tyrosine autokinase [Pyrinomonadaceae bacterium]